MTSHLFNDQAESYAKFRPLYPSKIFDAIYSYLGKDKPYNLAVDCATGTGQAAVTLATRFAQVVAFDVSSSQVSKAAHRPNIHYREGTAEDIDMTSSSADLVTVAQALHYFDLRSFQKEANRILRSNGVLAIWSGRRAGIANNAKAEALLQELCDGDDYLGPYWSKQSLMVNNEYASIALESSFFQAGERQQFSDITEWSIKHLVGYISTWSAHATYMRENKGAEDPRTKFKARLLDALGTQDDTVKLKIVLPYFLILAKARK